MQDDEGLPDSPQIGTLLAGMGAKNLPNLNNLAMELRKVCCHPVRTRSRDPGT